MLARILTSATLLLVLPLKYGTCQCLMIHHKFVEHRIRSEDLEFDELI